MAAWLADQIGLMRQTETWPPSSPPAGINEPSKQDGKGEMGMGGLIFTPTPVWVFQPGAPNANVLDFVYPAISNYQGQLSNQLHLQHAVTSELTQEAGR